MACVLPLVYRSGHHLDVVPSLVLIAVMVALTLGFASWWDIFGNGYGPRLTLPWVLPIVFTALVAYGDSLGDLALKLLSSFSRVLLVFAVVFVFTLPHVGHMCPPRRRTASPSTNNPRVTRRGEVV